MIKTIYYGNAREVGVTVTQPTIVSPIQGKLLIQTATISGLQSPKIHFLYYNNVNRYGEVLSTIVAILDVESVEASSYVLYDPAKFGMNSELEINQTLSGASNRWRNATLSSVNTQFLLDKSKDALHPYTHYDINVDIAHDPYTSTNFMLDGWYSMLSIAPTAAPAIVEDGVLRSVGDNVEYYYDGTWHDITGTMYTEAPIADIIRRTDQSALFLETQFFITHNTAILYDDLLSRELTSEWFTNVDTIRYKYRSIANAAEAKYLDKAQSLLRSIDLTLLA